MITTKSNTLSKEIEQFIENQRYQLVIKLSFIICFAFVILSASFISETLGSFLTMVSGVVITTVGLIYTYFSKKYKFTLVLYSFCGVVISGIALLEMHTATHYGEMLWMTAGIMLGFLGLGSKYGWTLVSIALSFILVFIWTELNTNLVSIPQRNDFQKFAVSAELVIAMCSVAYIFTVFLKFHSFSQNQLLLANENLETKNATISAQDEEKTILVKEIHHRVKNNLQIISSLLRLQGNDIENEELKKHFDEATNRIVVMSMIHQRLYDGKELSKIQLVQYLTELTNDLERIYAHQNPIKFSIQSNLSNIGLKSIVPIGLIFNELISNSLKYAFKETENATITIDIKELDNKSIQIIYTDNGIWIGDKNAKNGFGLELIDLLTEQLDGVVNLTITKNLTHYEFEFPNLTN